LFDSFWGFFYLQTKLNNEMLVFSERKKKIMTILFGFICYVSVFIFKNPEFSKLAKKISRKAKQSCPEISF